MADIVIIGAGASGLMAGLTLAKKKHKVTILEARDRIGGRIHTIEENFSFPVEGGAEFIHGKYPLSLSLAKKAGAKVWKVGGKRYQLWQDKLHDGDVLEENWKALSEKLNDLKDDTDMGTFLDQHFSSRQFDEFRTHIKGFVQGFDLADIHEVSAISLREEWMGEDEEHQYRIDGGYVRIINYLADELRKSGGELLLSSPATLVKWEKKKVSITTSNHKIVTGNKVIVTAPIGFLQQGLLGFSPALNGHDQSFKNIGFGSVIKFLFEFKTNFWNHGGERKAFRKIGFVFSDAPVPTWWMQTPQDKPLLTGWFGGPPSRDPSLTKDELYDRAIRSLHYIFRMPIATIESELVHWDIINWANDPWARGAYAYPSVKTKEARTFLNEPVENTIYFAGEALYDGPAMGTVEAALVSGKKVAAKISQK